VAFIITKEVVSVAGIAAFVKVGEVVARLEHFDRLCL
jgi:hypothetical protein